MKALLTLIFLIVFSTVNAQFIFKNGKSTAYADTLESNTDTTIFKNKTSKAFAKMVVKPKLIQFTDRVIFKNDTLNWGTNFIISNLDSIWIEKPLGTFLLRIDNIKTDTPVDSVKMLSTYDAAQAYLKIVDTTKLHNQITTKLNITDTTKLHNQIITKLNAADTVRYISKSQARSDIHDSIANVVTGKAYIADSSGIKTFIRDNSQYDFIIQALDTARIPIGNIFKDDGIFINRYVLKDTVGGKVMGESLAILTEINSLFVDYGKQVKSGALVYSSNFEIGIDLETIYWVIVNPNNRRLFLRYYKNSTVNN